MQPNRDYHNGQVCTVANRNNFKQTRKAYVIIEQMHQYNYRTNKTNATDWKCLLLVCKIYSPFFLSKNVGRKASIPLFFI